MINYKKTKSPKLDNTGVPIALTDATIQERHKKVLERMKENGYSSLIVYADKEHGGNFEYLVGFIPRFEEGLLVLNVDGTSTLLLGNENFNKVKYSRIEAAGIKTSLFSLPNQPMATVEEIKEQLQDLEIDTSENVGLVGWKLIPEMTDQYDLPEYVVNAIKARVDEEKIFNATTVFIGPENGARITNNANEIAHYEYGASLASDAVLEALNDLEVGKTEGDVGENLTKQGQYNNVVTISAFGERFVGGNIYPTDNQLEKGDKVALTTSYRGGLSSRTGYAVESYEELEEIDPGYFEEIVVPYFTAYHYWLTNIKIGADAGKFYEDFEAFYPQEKYGWELNPGHLTANEEWMSSPFYKDSKATVKSGMIFQVDFIPIQPPHQGVSAESTIALADEDLREAIQNEYPKLWARIVERREYIIEELKIELPEEVLPLASTVGYLRPFMLNKEVSLFIEK
ncbi:M24 family metallopeptidase [Alkalibacterium sp. m-11]